MATEVKIINPEGMTEEDLGKLIEVLMDDGWVISPGQGKVVILTRVVHEEIELLD